MVIRAGSTAKRSDDVFHALADATRRDMLLTLLTQESSVSALARRYPMSFAAVHKHLGVLERARLVTKQRRGRECVVRASGIGLADARTSLDAFERLWRDRVAQIEQILAEDPRSSRRT